VNLYRVPPLARFVGWIANKVDPSVFERVAITIGGTILYLLKPTPAIERHEWIHVLQSAGYCPRWCNWTPIRARAWIGLPWFLAEYRREHIAHGYDGNRFEIKARHAEVE
jgi:hypothetical protein